MKIVGVDTYALDFPQHPPWAYSKGWVSSAPVLLVEVQTDAGIRGLGEGYGPPHAVAAMIRSFCEPVVLGRDPLCTEPLGNLLRFHAQDFSASGTAMAAISAIDIACWDIKGKAWDMPVCSLLGGPMRTELTCYASAVRYQRDGTAEEERPLDSWADPAELALQFVEQGFQSIKMAIGLLEPRADLERVRRVREAIPDEIDLMVDANHAFNVRQAIFVGRALEDLRVSWFEDPLPSDDLPGYAALRSRLRIPLAGGEALSNRTSFREFFTRRLWDIAIVEVGLAGGLTECKKIIDLAETFGVECATHGFSSVAGTAAALHLAAVVPGPPSRGQTDCLPFEFAPPPFDRLADLMVEPFEVQDGTIQVPLARPGLGVELNREAVRRRLLK